eukprot:1146664-Pelagomonas_calceolata.AAC.1
MVSFWFRKRSDGIPLQHSILALRFLYSAIRSWMLLHCFSAQSAPGFALLSFFAPHLVRCFNVLHCCLLNGGCTEALLLLLEKMPPGMPVRGEVPCTEGQSFHTLPMSNDGHFAGSLELASMMMEYPCAISFSCGTGYRVAYVHLRLCARQASPHMLRSLAHVHLVAA